MFTTIRQQVVRAARLLRSHLGVMARRDVQAQIQAAKEARRAYQYQPAPAVTAIVQLFNKRQNIGQIIERLRLTPAEEIIVIDDGSVDGSLEEALKHLVRPNDFLLHSNDLFEVIMYDRALGMARGEVVCLLQDDDIPPADPTWMRNACALFERFPKLLVLGGRDGLSLRIPDSPVPGTPPVYRVDGNVGGCPGVNKFVIHDRPSRVTPQDQIPFMFTMTVNRAPMFVRRRELQTIGGIDQIFAPYQNDDADMCIRAWQAGYQVGLYECDFARNIGIGGMRLYNKGSVSAQDARNWKIVYDRYAPVIADGALDRMVDAANALLQERS